MAIYPAVPEILWGMVCFPPPDASKLSKRADAYKDTNYPYLHDIAVINFKRGETKLYLKERHSDKVFNSGEFLTKNLEIKLISINQFTKDQVLEVLTR